MLNDKFTPEEERKPVSAHIPVGETLPYIKAIKRSKSRLYLKKVGKFFAVFRKVGAERDDLSGYQEELKKAKEE